MAGVVAFIVVMAIAVGVAIARVGPVLFFTADERNPERIVVTREALDEAQFTIGFGFAMGMLALIVTSMVWP